MATDHSWQRIPAQLTTYEGGLITPASVAVCFNCFKVKIYNNDFTAYMTEGWVGCCEPEQGEVVQGVPDGGLDGLPSEAAVEDDDPSWPALCVASPSIPEPFQA